MSEIGPYGVSLATDIWHIEFPDLIVLHGHATDMNAHPTAHLAANQWAIESMYLEMLDRTGRQVQPGKRRSVARKVPPILDRLNLSPELWLQTIAGFTKRRSANSVTPASRFNAAALTTRTPMASNR